MRYTGLVISGCALLAAVQGTAAGQESPDTAVLQPVVVTATRVPVASAAATGSATVITGEQLRARGIRDVAEALRETPGAHVARSGSYGGITALFLRGGQSNYVKVLVDGVPVNDAGGAFDLAHLTTDQVDRIEIVRGPVGVLYGSDAVTGVVQIFTREGAGPPRAALAARGGGYGTREASVDASGALGAHSGDGARALRWSIGGGHRETDGIFEFNSGYRNSTAGGAAGFGSPGGTTVRLTGRFHDALAHYPTDGTGAAVDSNQYRVERRVATGLEAAQPLGSRVEARLHLRASDLRAITDDQPDSPGDSLGFYSRVETEGTRRSVDVRLDVFALATTVLTAGAAVEWQRERVDGDSRFAGFPPTTSAFEERRRNRALYSQLVGSGVAGSSFALGYRIDENEKFGTFGTWRAAASLPLPLLGELRFAAGTAFREPAFAEQFNTTFSLGNPDLRPERTRSWEVGVERVAFGGATRVGVTYFDQRFRDMIQYNFDPARPDTFNYYNVAAAEARGVEVTLSQRVARGMSASASHSALRTRVTDAGFGGFGTFTQGERLLRRPAHATTVAFDLARSGWSAHASAIRAGHRDDLDFGSFPSERVVLPAYTTVNVAGSARLLGGAGSVGLEATLRVENLLGERYRMVHGFDAPGRLVLAGARLTFGR